MSKAYPEASNGFQTRFLEGLAFHKKGKLAAAEKVYEEILRINPDFFDALHLFKIIVYETRRIEAGVQLAKSATNKKPSYASVYSKLKTDLTNLKCVEEALTIIEQAVSLNPEFIEPSADYIMAPKELDRPGGCERKFLLRPDCAVPFDKIGNALCIMGRFHEAVTSYDKAISSKPDYADAFLNRGIALRQLNRYNDAIASYDRAIALRPGYAEAFNNRGVDLRKLQRFDEAIASFDRAIALKPDYADAFNSRGNALFDLNRLEEALASYDKAIALKSDYAEAYSNQSYCLLLIGCFEQGWRHHEWRKRLAEPIASESYSQPLWLGEENISGKTMFIHWEQGFGDVIQFCRYAKMVEAKGAKVVMEVPSALRRLLKNLSSTIEIVDEATKYVNFDYHCPLMSLPLAFQTTLENIPAAIPYLRAEPDRVEYWKSRLRNHEFKIGIAWQGSKIGTEIGKAFSVYEFYNIAKIPNVCLVSLQKGDGVEQLENLPEGMEIRRFGDEFDAGPDAFLDTAAVMKNLDLIITTDTAIAHLAGALGCPAWVALKHVPDWRWMLDRSDSPWYPTIRLFRQRTRDDWAAVFLDIENALVALIGSKPDPREWPDSRQPRSVQHQRL